MGFGRTTKIYRCLQPFDAVSCAWSWGRRLANPHTAPFISANGTWVGCFSHAAPSETTLVCHHPSDHQYGAKRPSPGADRMANSSQGTRRFICTMRSAPSAIFGVISRTAASWPWLNVSCNSSRRSSIQYCRALAHASKGLGACHFFCCLMLAFLVVCCFSCCSFFFCYRFCGLLLFMVLLLLLLLPILLLLLLPLLLLCCCFVTAAAAGAFRLPTVEKPIFARF